ncbi:SRPBCC family protein [Streptomyces sp. NPDC004520]|uniref:SRPBCC family protein n=1 Tax=Streptomyces sp. NPDC004520 TaxID=3364702 RepID=UPI0036B21CD8
MDRQWSLEESTVVDAPPAVVYRLVSDLRNMGRWSPECRSVWVLRPPARTGTRFVGLNRRGPFLWPTLGRVTRMRPDSEFVFDIGVFGLPIARWGYRFEPEGSGTRITEFWQDLRTGGARGRVAELLGTVFAGSNPARRVALNRAGMRTTLARIARTATSGS